MRGLTEPPSGRKTPDGNAKISVLLNEHTSSSAESKPDVKGKRPQGGADGLPTEYKLTMQNTASKNLYVFGEKVEDDPDSGEEGARKKRRAFFPFSPRHIP
jgi:transcription initiation factor TFIIF subunit beta